MALKVLLAGGAADTDAAERFRRGARNAARIEHPNVCAVTDFGETADGRWFLAMEFIEGRSLGDLLREEGRLHPASALGIAVGVARALGAAHRLGIVHRDLKPDNVMLPAGAEADPARVKVVDFDIARAMRDETEVEITRAHQAIGTPEYMSPEQLMGQPLDARSDLYALGLILYRMLTGELPFSGANTQEVMASRLVRPPRPLEEAMAGEVLPEGVADLVGALLARDREHRLSKAETVVGALEAMWVRVTGAYPVGSTGVAGTAGAEDSAVLVGPAAPLDPASGAEPRPGRPSGVAIAGAAAAVVVLGGGVWLWGGGGELLNDVGTAPGPAASESVPGPPEPSSPQVMADAMTVDSATEEGGTVGTLPPGIGSREAVAEPLQVLPTEDRGVAGTAQVPVGPARSLPTDVSGLLSELGQALASDDTERVRALYPDVQERELSFWREAIESVGAEPVAEFEAQTAPELGDDGGEIRVLLLTLRGEAATRPFPIRARLDRGPDGGWRVAELLRLNE